MSMFPSGAIKNIIQRQWNFLNGNGGQPLFKFGISLKWILFFQYKSLSDISGPSSLSLSYCLKLNNIYGNRGQLDICQFGT